MKKAFCLAAATAVVLILTGCAHTGLVVGPAAPEVSVDRGTFIENINPEAAPFDSVPHVDIDALWEKGVLPGEAIIRIRLIQDNVSNVQAQLDNASLHRQELDTTLPDPTIQEPNETLLNRLAQAEAYFFGTPAPLEESE